MLARLGRVLLLTIRPLSIAPDLADFWQFLLTAIGLLGPPGASAWLANRVGLPTGPAFLIALVAMAALLVLWAAYRLQSQLDAANGPKLTFGPLFCAQKEDIYPGGQVSDVKIWRATIVNDGGDAEQVSVSARFVPALPHMPGWQPILTLHQFRDTRRSFSLRGNGGTAFIDIIAASNFTAMVSYVASVDAPGGYIYYEDDQLITGEYRIELEATAGRAKTARTVFAWFDSRQWMYMTEDQDSDPID